MRANHHQSMLMTITITKPLAKSPTMEPNCQMKPKRTLMNRTGAPEALLEHNSRYPALPKLKLGFLRANAFPVCREGKPLHTFPDLALVAQAILVAFGPYHA